MRAEVTADLLYLYVYDQQVPPESRCWFGAAWSIGINHHQSIHLFLQTERDSYIITANTDKVLYCSATHVAIGPEAVPVTAVPDPFRFLNAAMCCLCITLPKAWQPSLQLTILSLNTSKQTLPFSYSSFNVLSLKILQSVNFILFGKFVCFLCSYLICRLSTQSWQTQFIPGGWVCLLLAWHIILTQSYFSCQG